MDIPLSLPVEQVGALALAIPSVSFILVQLLKSLFYAIAPIGWQEALPDKRVWMGCAFAFCVAACVALRMDIPQHLFPDWPASYPLVAVGGGQRPRARVCADQGVLPAGPEARGEAQDCYRRLRSLWPPGGSARNRA